MQDPTSSPDGSIHLADFLAGGFLVTRFVNRPSYVSSRLLPDRLPTASDCIAEILPGTWALEWVSTPSADRTTAAAAFGLGPADLARLITWTTAAHDRDDFLWPCFFPSLSVVSSFLAEFKPSPPVTVLGIGLHRSLRDSFLHELTLRPAQHEFGLLAMIRAGVPLPELGKPLGFEILGTEFSGQSHSWLCNGLEIQVESTLGVRPNATGLLAKFADAQAAANLCGDESIGAEPVPWFPWLLVQYSDSGSIPLA